MNKSWGFSDFPFFSWLFSLWLLLFLYYARRHEVKEKLFHFFDSHHVRIFFHFSLEHVSMPFRSVFNLALLVMFMFSIFPIIFFPFHFVISFLFLECTPVLCTVYILFSSKKIAFIVQNIFQCPSSIEQTTTVMIIIINDLPTSRWINKENWLSEWRELENRMLFGYAI